MNEILKMLTSRSEFKTPYMMKQLANIFNLKYEETRETVNVSGIPVEVVKSTLSDKFTLV